MPQTRSLDVMMQQLNALSLVELLKVRAEVDALIEKKSLSLSNISSARSNQSSMFVFLDKRDNDIAISSIGKITGEIVHIFEVTTKTDDSLEKIIELVDEWMGDESGYDEETYPQLRQL